MAGNNDDERENGPHLTESQREEVAALAEGKVKESGNLFTASEVEVIKSIIRSTLVEQGFDANGPETRKCNIARMKFVDEMMHKFDRLTINIGRAVTYGIIAAILGALWIGFKTKILSGG